MKQIQSQKRTNIKEKLLPLPFFLLIAATVVLMLGGLLFLMYSIILVVALKSAMAFLIVFAAGGICDGLGILALNGFFAYGKYFKQQKGQIVNTQKKDDNANKTFKDYLTLQNIALVVLLIGAICAVVSAILGSMNREKWTQAVSSYMEKNNYYADVEYRDFKYTVGSSDDINKIVINLTGKNAVVIYTEKEQKQGFVVINGYEKYKNQIILTKNDKTLFVSEGEHPDLDGTLEKLLFFMFDENKIERQIKIYIPLNLKDAIQIEGEYILAQ